jgi:3-hydroxyacyl-CoA dehydrogenase
MNVQTPPTVTLARAGAVLVAEIHHPPVNALSHTVRTGLIAALDEAEANPEIAALVLAARGDIFSGGADLKEFGATMRPPLLGEVIERLERTQTLVVAAIQGPALGGGLELALACSFRIAAPGATFALPEVKLGILPGAGGIVRLPRLIGIDAALSMIAEGRQIDAAEASRLGLVDRIVDGDQRGAAVSFAQELAASGMPPRRASALPFPAFDQTMQDEARRSLATKYRGLEAPQKAIDLFAMAAETPFDEAARQEYAACKALLSAPQSRALRHLFAAKRAAAKAPEDAASRGEYRIDKAGVVGPGTMGSGIAIALLGAGLAVALIGRSESSLDTARKTIARALEGSVKRGKLTDAAMKEQLERLTLSTDFATLAGADLVVESVVEDLAPKQAVIAGIDAVVGDGTIIATNTSFLDVDELARSTRRPEHFAGLHFFNPAHLMSLVEVVRANRTAPGVIAALMALAKRLGKTAVPVGPSEGFVANRMLSKRTREALFLLQEGATPAQVDGVLTAFGFPVGPFALADMAGLDVLAATRAARWSRMSPRERDADIVERLVAAGRRGRKSGAGYYVYGQDGRPAADPAVDAVLDTHRRERGIVTRTISDTEVLERCLYALVNEGAKLLDEGTVARAGDIDVIWTSGLGFPAHLGGPMFWASETGLPGIRDALRNYAATVGPEYFAPAPSIERLAAGRERFA